MSKAEELASKEWSDLGFCNNEQSNAFKLGYLKGYNQAEKDFELTLKDIKIILDIENDILHECNDNSKLVIETYPKGEDYYGEILKRFKERKENKL